MLGQWSATVRIEEIDLENLFQIFLLKIVLKLNDERSIEMTQRVYLAR